MTKATLGLILLSVTMTALAQLVLKAGMSGAAVQRAIVAGHGARVFLAIASDPLVIVGLTLYVVAAAVWLIVLSKVHVSLAYPFVALGFVLTASLGRLLFNEALSVTQIAGIVLVCAGVALLARS